MDLGIAGKNALVLASSRGIGLGIAEALAAEGANVLLVGRTSERLADAAKQITERGAGKADFVTADLSDKNAAKTIFDAATEKLGDVDILINSSGGPAAGAPDEVTPDTWRMQFDTMVLRLFEISNLCVPAMQKNGWGRIITVGSSGVLQPIPNMVMSNTLRSGVVAWTKTMSNAVAKDGITVNSLVPGRIHTERVDELDALAAKRMNKTPAEAATASRATIPMGRYGTVEEFASVATFLASKQASYITGTIVRCDGGIIRST